MWHLVRQTPRCATQVRNPGFGTQVDYTWVQHLGAVPFEANPQVCNPSAAPSNYGSAYRWACFRSMLEWFKVLKSPVPLFPLNEHGDSDNSVIIAHSDRHDRYTTTSILIDWVRFCNKSMMMQMELRDIDLKPVGNGNWDGIWKKSSHSDENCESDIGNTVKFFFGCQITILPFWYPNFMKNGFKKCISGQILAK